MNITNRTLILTYVGAIISLTGMQTAVAGTTNLSPIADTFIRNLSAANTNFGDVSPLLVGLAKEPPFIQNRALLKFDFSGIPTNVTVTGVTLTISLTANLTDPSDFDLNRMLLGWNENETTWNNRFTSTPWLAGGCQSGTEYVSSPSVTAEIDSGVFSSPGMIADVQRWVGNSATNFGWIMIATGDKSGTGKKIGSRESEFSPVLTVDYNLTPPPSAAAPTIFGAAQIGNGFRFSFDAESNRTYAVEFRDSLTISNWNLLTNISASPVNRIINITNPIISTERYFRTGTP